MKQLFIVTVQLMRQTKFSRQQKSDASLMQVCEKEITINAKCFDFLAIIREDDSR
jgi:predicted lipid carrier protein YhbT